MSVRLSVDLFALVLLVLRARRPDAAWLQPDAALQWRLPVGDPRADVLSVEAHPERGHGRRLNREDPFRLAASRPALSEILRELRLSTNSFRRPDSSATRTSRVRGILAPS